MTYSKRRTLNIAFLIGSAILLLAVILLPREPKFSSIVCSEEEAARICSGRTEDETIQATISFDEQQLLFTSEEDRYWYSIPENQRGKFDPAVSIRSDHGKYSVSFVLPDSTQRVITDNLVKANEKIRVIVFDRDCYKEFTLTCTTLPIMAIDLSGRLSEDDTEMQMTLWDNRESSVQSLIESDGFIHIRGTSSKEFPRNSYRLSLKTESPGNSNRANRMSLLGLRQDDEWILYSPYNDQERIRNVFAMNLWNSSMADNNSLGIHAGTEYQYIELLMNGRYWGLYAICAPISEKSLSMTGDLSNNALYQKKNWESVRFPMYTYGSKYGDATVGGFSVKHHEVSLGNGAENNVIYSEEWIPLLEYYATLNDNETDSRRLLQALDVDNSIDLFLFINFVQGMDHVAGSLLKNFYLRMDKSRSGWRAIYIPWDLDLTFGNGWNDAWEQNHVFPYGIPSDQDFLLGDGYLYQLLINGDTDLLARIIDRYWELRECAWSVSALNEMLDVYEKQIFDSGAYLRDIEAWPNSTKQAPEKKLSLFRKYLKARLEHTDAYFHEVEKYGIDIIQDTESHEIDDTFEYYEMDLFDRFEFVPQIETFEDPRIWIKYLPYRGCNAVIQIRDSRLWNCKEFRELFGEFKPDGCPGLVIYDNSQKKFFGYRFFFVSDERLETEIGSLLYVEYMGKYGLYLGNSEVYTGSLDFSDCQHLTVTLYDEDNQYVSKAGWKARSDGLDHNEMIITEIRRE